MVLPTLKGTMINGFPASGRIYWNAKVKDQLLGLFEEIEHENLTVLIHQWGGSWVV